MNPGTFISITFIIGQTKSKSKVFLIEATKTEKQISAATRVSTDQIEPLISVYYIMTSPWSSAYYLDAIKNT